MTFKELKDAIAAMDDIQLLQLVLLHDSGAECEMDLAVKHSGIPVFLMTMGDDDGSEMASE